MTVNIATAAREKENDKATMTSLKMNWEIPPHQEG